MKRIFLFLFLITTAVLATYGQEQPERRDLRIVDTLSASERTGRNTVILRSELDSMIKLHNESLVKPNVQLPVQKEESAGLPIYLVYMGMAILVIIAVLLYSMTRSQRRANKTIYALNRKVHELEWLLHAPEKNTNSSQPASKTKQNAVTLEKKLLSVTAELEKAKQQNEGLELVLDEYRHIKQEYESVKQQMMDVYKIRNYPGFAKEKSETEIVKALLSTERSVAAYAYEHFLKPVITIVDANKNNPARISPEEGQRVMDLLVSLSLLYSEYLYLRVNDLAVGGKMVERLGSLKNGNSLDLSLLKELNTEHGSRALALRMALDKAGVQQLSYPVFDETNLNLS